MKTISTSNSNTRRSRAEDQRKNRKLGLDKEKPLGGRMPTTKSITPSLLSPTGDPILTTQNRLKAILEQSQLSSNVFDVPGICISQPEIARAFLLPGEVVLHALPQQGSLPKTNSEKLACRTVVDNYDFVSKVLADDLVELRSLNFWISKINDPEVKRHCEDMVFSELELRQKYWRQIKDFERSRLVRDTKGFLPT